MEIIYVELKDLLKTGFYFYLVVMLILAVIWVIIGLFIYDEDHMIILFILIILFSLMIFLAVIPKWGFIIQIFAMVFTFMTISYETGIALTGLIVAMWIAYGILGLIIAVTAAWSRDDV